MREQGFKGPGSQGGKATPGPARTLEFSNPRTLVLLLLAAFPLLAVDLNPPEVRSLAGGAIEHAYRQEYDEAHADANRLIARYPDNPAGYFFSGALLELEIFDRVDNSLEPAFLDLMRKTEEKAGAILCREENAWAYFYLGAARTYRAVFYGWDNRYWDCFYWGTRAPAPLNAALALDTSINDARLCLGVNEYFHYSAGRYLSGLGVFGSYERSKELVRQSINSDGYLVNTARYSLAWMFSHERQFPEAHELLAGMLTDYPGNRICQRLLRDTYRAQKSYDSVIAVAEELNRELPRRQPGNRRARAENHLALANACFERGNRERAAAFCDSIISDADTPGIAKFAEQARALKKRL